MGSCLLFSAPPLACPSPPLPYGEISKPFFPGILLVPRASPQDHQAQPWQQQEVALYTQSYLRSDVVGSPTERGCRHTVQNPLLAHPEVGQFAVTFRIQKDVVQFQIPARQARTTWLMLHSSQNSLLELERGAHLRKFATESKVLRRLDLPAPNFSIGLSPIIGQPPKLPPLSPM